MLSRLNEIIAKYDLLNHRFYQAWSAGQLSISTLRHYAAEYYAQVSSFPRFISRVHSNCPEIEARKVLLRNLVDEEIHGQDHPSLWTQFAQGLGVSEADLKAENKLPATLAMVDTYYDLADSHWTDGLCALYAYEAQVPAVSVSKIEGLRTFYGIDDAETLAFFHAHQVYDVEHAREVGRLIDSYADSERAAQATEKAAQALWQFLDGVSDHAGLKACDHI